MTHIGFRLNPEKHEEHQEIREWLDRFEGRQKSDEARRLILLGIHLAKGKLLANSAEVVSTEVQEEIDNIIEETQLETEEITETNDVLDEPLEPLEWAEIPEEPTVKSKQKEMTEEEKQIAASIIGSFPI